MCCVTNAGKRLGVLELRMHLLAAGPRWYLERIKRRSGRAMACCFRDRGTADEECMEERLAPL